MILEQLHIEIDPRLDKEEQTKLEELRKETYKNYTLCKKKKLTFQRERNVIRKYHMKINRLAHAKGLILKDEEKTNMSDFMGWK